jgi:hypothetical protein
MLCIYRTLVGQGFFVATFNKEARDGDFVHFLPTHHDDSHRLAFPGHVTE